MRTPPRSAAAAQVRCILAHTDGERDGVVRRAAENLRALRGAAVAGDVDLYDWDAGHDRPELFRWLLELSGEPGARPALVAAAAAAGRISASDAAWLARPMDRPAWADGEVPWQVDSVETVGDGHGDVPPCSDIGPPGPRLSLQGGTRPLSRRVSVSLQGGHDDL